MIRNFPRTLRFGRKKIDLIIIKEGTFIFKTIPDELI